MKTFTISFLGLLVLQACALAWGDNGHEAIALVARQCLSETTMTRVLKILNSDADNITRHDIAGAATWADKYRSSADRNINYRHTQHWHFVDMQIESPDLDAACFGRPKLPAGEPASGGPDEACAIDKLRQFIAELRAPDTDAQERAVVLKFVLHLIADIHQPLHVSDNHDRGGNGVKIIVDGFPPKPSDNLHGFVDTQFVDAIGTTPESLAAFLLNGITPAQAKHWAAGSPEDWTKEAFEVAVSDIYGTPPLSTTEVQHLDSKYVARMKDVVALQLSRAGIRLALTLNQALDQEATNWDACLKSR
jgi:nuclease S1